MRDIRRELGLTQKAIAERVGVTQSVIGKHEANLQSITWETAKNIAREFNVPPWKLYRDTECFVASQEQFEDWMTVARELDAEAAEAFQENFDNAHHLAVLAPVRVGKLGSMVREYAGLEGVYELLLHAPNE